MDVKFVFRRVVKIIIFLLILISSLVTLISSLTNVNISIISASVLIFLLSVYFLLPLINMLTINKNNGSRFALNATFVLQFATFMSAVYAYNELLLKDYTQSNFWVITFFIFISFFFILHLGRTIYQKKTVGIGSVSGLLYFNLMPIMFVFIIILVTFEGSVARTLGNMSQPNSVSIVTFHRSHNSTISGTSQEITNKFLINQVLDQVGNKKVNNLHFFQNYKYFIDLMTSSKYYVLSFSYIPIHNEMSLENGYVDTIVIMPNREVYMQESKLQSIPIKDRYIRYKIDISDNLIEELIKYAEQVKD